MKLLVVHPGASWSTHDVHVGVVEGLKANGVSVAEWRLDGRIKMAHNWLHYLWRQKLKVRDGKEWPQPTQLDVLHHATIGVIERAIECDCQDVLIITAMFLPADRISLMRKAGLRVWLLCTESPYHMDDETRIAAICDGVFTNERAAIDAFKAMQPKTAYLRHAYRSGVHDVAVAAATTSDVFFCGSMFPERIAWLTAIDWRGIDFHLYTRTQDLPRNSKLRKFMKGGITPNADVVQLAKASKITLNLFRDASIPADSLNPRCYELAAAGTCLVTNDRAEVRELMPETPIVSSPEQAGDVFRALLADDVERRRIAAAQQTAIHGQTWTVRARELVDQIQQWHS
jgi:hypothetical protein